MRSDNPSNSTIGLSGLWTQVLHEDDTMTEDSVEEISLRLENDLRRLSPSVVAATEETMCRMDEAVREIAELRMGTLILPEADDEAVEEEEEEALNRDAEVTNRGEEIRAWAPFWREAAVQHRAPVPEEENLEDLTQETGGEEEGQGALVLIEREEVPTRTWGTRFKEWIQGIFAVCGNCMRAVLCLICYCFAQIKAKVSYCVTSSLAGAFRLWNNTKMFFRSILSRISYCAAATYEMGQDLTTHAMEAVFVIADNKMTPTLVGGLCLGLAAAVVWIHPSPTLPSPKDDLRDFVTFEKTHNVVDLTQIEELNTEAFRTYARSTCVEAATFERTRDAVAMGLYGIPESVRQGVVAMAVIEGVTQKNSIQNSSSDFVDDGKAEAHMAFWSTVYNPRDKDHAYKVCVMVTGVVLTVAETVAEWTTKTERYLIGTNPCHCGKWLAECGWMICASRFTHFAIRRFFLLRAMSCL
jgi:hypothetical protein